jgi:hypothetical protein
MMATASEPSEAVLMAGSDEFDAAASSKLMTAQHSEDR